MGPPSRGVGECLGGALYIEDFKRLFHKAKPFEISSGKGQRSAGFVSFENGARLLTFDFNNTAPPLGRSFFVPPPLVGGGCVLN